MIPIRDTSGPTPSEIQAACETLIRSEPMNGEAFRVVMGRLVSEHEIERNRHERAA